MGLRVDPAISGVCWEDGYPSFGLTSRPLFFINGYYDTFYHYYTYQGTIEWNGVAYSPDVADCGNTSTYIHNFWPFPVSNGIFAIDLIGAYDAGAWTSSTTIKIRDRSGVGVANPLLYAHWGNTAGQSITYANSIAVGPFACPTNVMKTITVLDDGTFSVA